MLHFKTATFNQQNKMCVKSNARDVKGEKKSERCGWKRQRTGELGPKEKDARQKKSEKNLNISKKRRKIPVRAKK